MPGQESGDSDLGSHPGSAWSPGILLEMVLSGEGGGEFGGGGGRGQLRDESERRWRSVKFRTPTRSLLHPQPLFDFYFRPGFIPPAAPSGHSPSSHAAYFGLGVRSMSTAPRKGLFPTQSYFLSYSSLCIHRYCNFVSSIVRITSVSCVQSSDVLKILQSHRLVEPPLRNYVSQNSTCLLYYHYDIILTTICIIAYISMATTHIT